MTGARALVALAAATLTVALTGCSSPTSTPAAPATPAPRASPTTPTTAAAPTSPAATDSGAASTAAEPEPEPGTVPPSWLGTRPLPVRPDGYGQAQPTPPELTHRLFTLPDTLPMLPGKGFAAKVEPVPAEVLARSTWEPSCPVAADELSYVRLTFWGFDERRHTGELLVNRSVARDLVSVFLRLYEARFPFEELRVTPLTELDAPPTGDGNDTGAFVCRPATGSTTGFSQHAYGLAIDVDPFQNPYTKGGLVLPELASAYLDRGDVRPAMITPDSVVVRAFARIGWEWGGNWSSLKDYQHFSLTGR